MMCTSLCDRCAKSSLFTEPWQENQIKSDDVVLQSWELRSHDPSCALCCFIQDEVGFVGRLERKARTLSKFAEAFVEIGHFVDMMKVENEVRLPGTDYDSDLPRRLLDSIEKKEGPRCLADCIICKPPQNEARARILSQAGVWQAAESLRWGIQTAREVHWKDEDHKERLSQAVIGCLPVLQRMKPVFAGHRGSESCLVCRFVSGDIQYLSLNSTEYVQLSQSEKKLTIANHVPPHVDWDIARILKVDLILERHDQWNAFSIREYKHDLKLTLPPSVHSPDGIQDEETSRIAEPRTKIEETVVSLRRTFRESPKDSNVFIPISDGTIGHARKVADEINTGMLKLWLDRCRENHLALCGRLGSEVTPKGLILIDTVENCLYDVEDGQRPKYTALSYVWGNVNQPTLVLDVYKNWRQPAALSHENLSQTVRDAMDVTKSVGIRYLWVDALCIVQDQSTLRHEQINQMYLIYQQAELTLVAADGDDCSAGLAGISRFQDRTEARGTFTIMDLQLAKVPSEPNYALQASHWRTRGWTFQEELCSRRALIFLPNIVLFSCPSAVWREDICLEGDDLPRSEGGLKSLLSMLSTLPRSSKEGISLFRGLVKQYVQRTLTRTDDMENGFAGVAGMMEQNIFGPIYHGIPEAYFGEIVEGCWFWDIALRERRGFPSWSWSGWIYEKEQADSGIEPLRSLGETSDLLRFFKLGTNIQALGHPSGDDHERLSYQDIRPDLVSHFIPDQGTMQLAQTQFIGKQGIPTYLIAFNTSMAYLELRAPPGRWGGRTRDYVVVHPGTKRVLTSLHVAVSFVSEYGTLNPFILIAHCRLKKAFRLMLVRMVDGIFFKVNVTTPRRPINEDDWCSLQPTKTLVVMA